MVSIVKQINLHFSEMEILAQTLCATVLPLDPTVFTPTTFRHIKRLPIRISKPSHKKFHFKKQSVIINRREYEDIIAKFSTVLKLDEDWNIFDWKAVATDIVRKSAQWHFKFNECKRFIFTKQSNNNLRSKNVTVRGEVLYRSDLCSENTIIKKGKSLSALRPNSVVTGNCLKGNKSSIADLLGKHYGPDWRQNPDLEFYTIVDRARAGEPLHVLESEDSDEEMLEISFRVLVFCLCYCIVKKRK
jgi:hypothetical protein